MHVLCEMPKLQYLALNYYYFINIIIIFLREVICAILRTKLAAFQRHLPQGIGARLIHTPHTNQQ